MFGGRKSAPALPSRMVGFVETDLVEAPAASDDVLRRAMDAASVTAVAAGLESERILRPQAPVAEEHTLPTLFLHGKPAGQVEDPPPLEPQPQPQPEPEPEVLHEVLPPDPEATLEPEPPVSLLEVTLSFQELVGPTAPASELVLACAREQVSAEEEDLVLIVDETAPLLEFKPVALQAAPFVAEPESVTETSAEDAAPTKKTAAKKSTARKKAATTPGRKKAGKAFPDDAVWLTDAMIWSQCGSWREFWLPPTDANSSQRIDEIRALATAGKLVVWAKSGESEEFSAIAAAHWKKAGFDPLAFLAGRENAFSQAPPTRSRTKTPAEPVKYRSLMVSRAEVEMLFGVAEAGTGVTAVA